LYRLGQQTQTQTELWEKEVTKQVLRLFAHTQTNVINVTQLKRFLNYEITY